MRSKNGKREASEIGDGDVEVFGGIVSPMRLVIIVILKTLLTGLLHEYGSRVRVLL